MRHFASTEEETRRTSAIVAPDILLPKVRGKKSGMKRLQSSILVSMALTVHSTARIPNTDFLEQLTFNVEHETQYMYLMNICCTYLHRKDALTEHFSDISRKIRIFKKLLLLLLLVHSLFHLLLRFFLPSNISRFSDFQRF